MRKNLVMSLGLAAGSGALYADWVVTDFPAFTEPLYWATALLLISCGFGVAYMVERWQN